jgi:hypothetical protein
MAFEVLMRLSMMDMRMRSEDHVMVVERQSSGVRVHGISARGHLPILPSFEPYGNDRNETHSGTRPEDLSCRTYENEDKANMACQMLLV